MKHIGTRPIETERLILRKMTLDDVQAMYDNWATDEEVTRYLTWDPHESIDVTRNIVQGWVDSYEKVTRYLWAITLKGQDEVVGTIDVVREEDEQTAVIGYCLMRSLWGQGIMTEALKAVLDYTMNEVGYTKVIAEYDVRNPASGRVMMKSGMTYQGQSDNLARDGVRLEYCQITSEKTSD